MPLSFTKYPSIEQFRNVVSYITKKCHESPTITFIGTVKIHGTNAGIGWDGQSEDLLVQSRKQTITPEKDNAGFATFVEANKDTIKDILRELGATSEAPVFIYGEWCGRGIQKGVGICELQPMFVIFNVLKGDQWLRKDDVSKILPSPASESRVFNIYQFPTYSLDITFKQPELGIAQNKLADLTEMVEQCCPVAKHFGIEGIGEGIVWQGRGVVNDTEQLFRFKVKGEKHSVSKVKTLSSVDVEKLKNLDEFIEYAVTENRMQQGYDELFKDTEPSNKDIGRFIKWVHTDVIKEESDTLETNGLEPKDIGKDLSRKCREWFLNYIG